MQQDWGDKIEDFVQTIANSGAANGLSQTLLKLVSPGVPDLYQGTEFWDFSLVDPDNRRPVDFAARARALGGDASVSALAGSWRDGRIKQALIRQTLAVRRRRPQLFEKGSYLTIEASGAAEKHVVAFARQHENAAALVVVSRLPAQRLERENIAAPALFWGDASLKLPAGFPSGSLRDVLMERTLANGSADIRLASILDTLPVALFVSAS
jgi:maltooligosyltrehalose synthase